LFPRLVRPMIVVMPRVLAHSPPEVPFTVWGSITAYKPLNCGFA